MTTMLTFLHPTCIYWLKVIFWILPGLVALWLAIRSPSGGRSIWLVVALYCLVISIDKAVDLQMLAYVSGRWILHRLDSILSLEGGRGPIRTCLCGLCFLLGLGITIYLVRKDRHLSLAKVLALGSLLLIMAYVPLRLLPPLHPLQDPLVNWIIEGSCAGMVWLGLWLGWRKRRNESGRTG